MKIEERMYVRIKNETGWCCIGKIQNINDYREPSMKYCIDIQSDDFVFVPEDMIVKASHNIAEILEAGDFLDFHRIEKIEGTTIFLTDGWFIDFDDVEDLVGTICTKEQFRSMSYKVGE